MKQNKLISDTIINFANIDVIKFNFGKFNSEATDWEKEQIGGYLKQ